jgi:ATP-dependent Lon protease
VKNDNSDRMQEEQYEDDENTQPGTDVVLISEIFPDKLIILPVYERPVFPGLLAPLTFAGAENVEALNAVFNTTDKLIGVCLVKTEDEQDPKLSEYHPVGTILKLHKINLVSENIVQVFAHGLGRFSYVRTVRQSPFLKWEVKYHYTPPGKPDDELKAYTLSIISSLKELLKKNPIFQEQLKMVISQITYEKPGILMDLVASMLTADPLKLQDLLETFNLHKRSEKMLLLLKEEIELSDLQQKIQKQIEEKISTQEKEFFLREQLKVIKKELGLEKDDKTSEIEKIENRIRSLKLSQEALQVVHEELDKITVLEPASSEFHVTRTYLHALTELPWGIYSKDRLSIADAREILDRDHYGLNDVKQAILQFLATIIKRGKLSGSIICLVGPPGVGKTSIGRSIADALNRKFYRFSVGGMRDEAEIKGHRRTYIGAMPGKIIQSLKRSGTANPVIMLDEIDKIGSSYQGDPASALLEVLDPEQNRDFLDHYLDVRFDLSQVLFITTANQMDTIPQPLLDRMEVIKLSGYIRNEKVQIAKKYLIPRQMEAHGLNTKEVKITDAALHQIVEGYAREAGVRNLENQIKKIMRQITLQQAEGETKKHSISIKNIEDYLGQPIFAKEELYEKEIPGVSLGLAWTSMGGATLYIEASAIKGSTGFKQTGQLGKVMQESSEIAYSYTRSLIAKMKQQQHFFANHFIHLHVPAGATPKDGPSAGITMALALYSLALNKAVRKGIAMTGELTLTGKVLPIGGIREKTLAARRVGVFELIFPKENQKDYDKLPDYLKEGITVHYADYFEDILKIALPDT